MRKKKTAPARGRPRRHNWQDIFRAPRLLRRGGDYDCSDESMAQQVRNAASAAGLRVRISMARGGIFVEVVNA